MAATDSLKVNLQIIASDLSVPVQKVQAAVDLLDEGNTIPFIARYRKERTGGLDDEHLRRLADQLARLRALETRRGEILRLLDEQGHLNDDLAAQVRAAVTVQRLDDLYRPFRPKRKTRASTARDRGLEPLADWLLGRRAGDPAVEAQRYVNDEVPDADAALQGARDIVAERLSDDAGVRETVRRITWRTGSLVSVLRPGERDEHYRAYAAYSEPLRRLPAHRILAINRGEREEALRASIEPDTERCRIAVERAAMSQCSGRRPDRLSPATGEVRAAAADGYKRLIAPAIEREVRAQLTAMAEEQALKVFGSNLNSLLLQPPLRDHVVMGLDPAYRTGVKVAVVAATGRVLDTAVVFPTPPFERREEAARRLTELAARHHVTAVAIGNGTASRETESFVAEWLQGLPADRRPAYAIVDEAGASVYSASKEAQKEFPQLDVSERSAVSIARRLQDPLAELVKIDPRSLGVGQYQHDVDSKRLAEQLTGVVEAAVNQVGVELNTASVELLSYVAGLSPAVAAAVINRRHDQGPFARREDLLAVSRLGARTFQQCAGFLRIADGSHPLDQTPIHPESYAVAEGLLERLGLKLDQVGSEAAGRKLAALSAAETVRWAAELGCGEPTLRDMFKALQAPGRDPREDLPPPALRADVLDLDDLSPGLVLSGTVRNVVDFGAFVDIGVKQDGLVHISELSDTFVKHPLDVVAAGQTVEVRVLSVDAERGRISLSMKKS